MDSNKVSDKERKIKKIKRKVDIKPKIRERVKVMCIYFPKKQVKGLTKSFPTRHCQSD